MFLYRHRIGGGHPETWGNKWSIWLAHIFQVGWFNHQLDIFVGTNLLSLFTSWIYPNWGDIRWYQPKKKMARWSLAAVLRLVKIDIIHNDTFMYAKVAKTRTEPSHSDHNAIHLASEIHAQQHWKHIKSQNDVALKAHAEKDAYTPQLEFWICPYLFYIFAHVCQR